MSSKGNYPERNWTCGNTTENLEPIRNLSTTCDEHKEPGQFVGMYGDPVKGKLLPWDCKTSVFFQSVTTPWHCRRFEYHPKTNGKHDTTPSLPGMGSIWKRVVVS